MITVLSKETFFGIDLVEKVKYGMPFEFKEKYMNWIFRGMKGRGVEICTDDIVLYSNTLEKHEVIVGSFRMIE